MQSEKTPEYSGTLVYVPQGYHDSKILSVKIIGDFNEWKEEECQFDRSLGMFYFIIKTVDLGRSSTFKFVSYHANTNHD